MAITTKMNVKFTTIGILNIVEKFRLITMFIMIIILTNKLKKLNSSI